MMFHLKMYSREKKCNSIILAKINLFSKIVLNYQYFSCTQFIVSCVNLLLLLSLTISVLLPFLLFLLLILILSPLFLLIFLYFIHFYFSLQLTLLKLASSQSPFVYSCLSQFVGVVKFNHCGCGFDLLGHYRVFTAHGLVYL